ncbi:MAG: hypothetical protein HN826_00455 [Methylococcales bacterium]|nr:hypothetical protein [Methylococcales bacterium]
MKFNRLVVCGLLVFLMIGCGSGSGGSSSVDFSDATSQGSSGSNPSKSISGTASKGILIDATVTIVELDLDGNTLNIVGGPVNTDSSGNYSITLNELYANGPIKVLIEANSNTEMVCDVTSGCLDDNNKTVAFGVNLSVTSLEMTTLLSSVNDGENTAHVTPYTHMAAESVKNEGAFSGDNIKKANSAIKDLIGIDPVNTTPIDITKDISVNATNDQIIYSTFNSAIAKQAVIQNKKIGGTVSLLAESFKGGSINASSSGSEFSLDSIRTQTEDQFNNNPKIIQKIASSSTGDLAGQFSTDINTIKQKVANNVGGVVTPIGVVESDSDIENAKAMLSTARSFGFNIQELGKGTNSPVRQFSEQIQSTSTLAESLQSDASSCLNNFPNTIKGFIDSNKGSELLPANGNYSVKTNTFDGSIQISGDNNQRTMTIDGINTSCVVNITLKFPVPIISSNILKSLISGTIKYEKGNKSILLTINDGSFELVSDQSLNLAKSPSFDADELSFEMAFVDSSLKWDIYLAFEKDLSVFLRNRSDNIKGTYTVDNINKKLVAHFPKYFEYRNYPPFFFSSPMTITMDFPNNTIKKNDIVNTRIEMPGFSYDSSGTPALSEVTNLELIKNFSDIKTANIHFNGTVEQSGSDFINPAKFEGAFEFSTVQCPTCTKAQLNVVTGSAVFNLAKFSLSGKLSNNTNSIDAAITIGLLNPESYDGRGNKSGQVNLAVSFNVSLENRPNTVVSFSTLYAIQPSSDKVETTPDSVTVSDVILTLSQNGQSLEIKGDGLKAIGDFAQQNFTISNVINADQCVFFNNSSGDFCRDANQKIIGNSVSDIIQGVLKFTGNNSVMVLKQDQRTGKRVIVGDIKTLDDKTVANISEQGDFIKVTFTDGTFESLF